MDPPLALIRHPLHFIGHPLNQSIPLIGERIILFIHCIELTSESSAIISFISDIIFSIRFKSKEYLSFK